MNITFFKRFLLISIILLSSSCISRADTDLGYEIFSQVELGNELRETSGLVCDGTGIYSVNDSGNPSILYTLDEQGNTTPQKLMLNNKDWEALTVTADYFFIGDIGNNGGKRTNLAIYKVNRKTLELEQKLTIRYKNNNKPAYNVNLAHDYDGEAITYKDDKLVLFSKSWKSNIANVYLVDPNKSNQELTTYRTIEGLPGVITGADFDENTKTFFIVGYKTSGLGFPVPFLATLSDSYHVQKVYKLSTFSQVEGVCSHRNKVWFTQEETLFKSAKLVSLILHSRE